MERQRSFSFTFKFTRFILFCFTLSFSVILLTFFSFWFMQTSPSIQRQITYLNLDYTANKNNNTPSSSFYFQPLNLKSLRGPNNNFSEVITKSSYTPFVKPGNSSGSVDFSTDEENAPEPAIIDMEDAGAAVAKNRSFFGHEDGNYGSSVVEVLVAEEKVEEMKGGEVGDVGEVKGTDGNSTGSVQNGGGVSEDRDNTDNEKGFEDCDVSEGKWVFDDSYTSYTNFSCPFIDEGFDCQGNGRSDKEYTKWIWQPKDCDISSECLAWLWNCKIKRFNATNMLELIRGKRLVFVGDSINRNQWESMLCLLMGAIKDPKRVYETHGRRITKGRGNYSFKFRDYRCTVEFYVSHYLVHEGTARIGRKRKPTLRIDRVDRGSSRWKGADILIFNTANWWSHSKTRAGINYYQEGDQVYPELEVLTAFRKAVTTWATWVDRHINPRRTRVFFRSSAPAHFRGGRWNTGGHCREARRPLNESYTEDIEKDVITMDVIRQMRTPVTFLNVTGLSGYRIDGHPSIYGSSARRTGIQDCSHWCLPGVPDTWNQLLYHQLLLKQKGMHHST